MLSHLVWRADNALTAYLILELNELYSTILRREGLMKYANEYFSLAVINESYTSTMLYGYMLFLSFLDIRYGYSNYLFALRADVLSDEKVFVRYSSRDNVVEVLRITDNGRLEPYLAFPYTVSPSRGDIVSDFLKIYSIVRSAVPRELFAYTLYLNNASLYRYGREYAIMKLLKNKTSYTHYTRYIYRELLDNLRQDKTIGSHFRPFMRDRLCLLIDNFVLNPDKLDGLATEKLDGSFLAIDIDRVRGTRSKFGEYALLMRIRNRVAVQLVRGTQAFLHDNVLFPVRVASLDSKNNIVSDILSMYKLYRGDRDTRELSMPVTRFLRLDRLAELVVTPERVVGVTDEYIISILKEEALNNDISDEVYDAEYYERYSKALLNIFDYIGRNPVVYDLATMSKISVNEIPNARYPVVLVEYNAYPLRELLTDAVLKHVKALKGAGEVNGLRIELDNTDYIVFIHDILSYFSGVVFISGTS